MKFGKIICFLSLLLWSVSACQDPEYADPGIKPGEEVTLFMNVQVPSTTLPGQTRNALPRERVVENITVLVLEKSGDTYLYRYPVEGQSVSSGAENVYYFHARLVATDAPLKLLVLANAAQDVSGIPVNATEADVKAGITRNYPEVSTGMEGILPMSAELLFPSGITIHQEAALKLTRSVARVDVYNGVPADFELLSVQIFRAHRKICILPEESGEEAVTTPTIPGGSVANIHTEAVEPVGDEHIPVYLPESAGVTEKDRQVREATCVVIGGLYKGDTSPSYYRMDFVPEGKPELFGQVLRNHKYVFTIQKVVGRGWENPEDASRNTSSQMQAEIKEWNENSVNMSFDGVNHLAVSARELMLDAIAGDKKFLEVDTSLDTYHVCWLDDAGNETAGTLYPGGAAIVDDEGWFQLTINDDGTRLTFTTLQENTTGKRRTRTLRIRADRLSLTCDIHQGLISRSNRQILIYGSLLEIGRFGNAIFPGSVAPDRPAAMVRKLRNTSNFGPDTPFRFDGFEFGGMAVYEIPDLLISAFDVVYLTYAGNPAPDHVIHWIDEKPNRVLIVQYDNSSTNKAIMDALGVPFQQKADVAPYVLHPDAPAHIIDGPFGVVSPSLQFRCYDTTHGEIPLEDARANNITPILTGGTTGGVVLGVDLDRHIIYSGDIDLYYSDKGGNAGQGTEWLDSSTGIDTANNAEKLIFNLWAWIAEVTLGQ
ncbi:MAG: hypothetical protein LUF04_01285 [Bacteroides sp.]|nr:hypothetical protein [Bacteroides sp.]